MSVVFPWYMSVLFACFTESKPTYCSCIFTHTVGADSNDLSSLLSELRVNEEERRRKASQSYVSCGPTTTDVRDDVVDVVSSVNVCMYRLMYVCVYQPSCTYSIVWSQFNTG